MTVIFPGRVKQPSFTAAKREIERMLKADVIEPATFEWAIPVVLITKKDGDPRFCVDYRRVNALTKTNSYTLPRIDECLDSLVDARIFTTLDCNSGYWQIPVAPEDRDKTAFVSHELLYRFKRMPFGLVNAPAAFQRCIDLVLISVKWKKALFYVDDVIIFIPILEEHHGNVSKVLSLVMNAGVYLKFCKCHFFQPAVDYLGHVFHPGKLAVASKNIESIAQAEHPRTRTEFRSFLGMCNVYRKFVPNFAKAAAPPTNLLKKGL
jgi:Reverse transcriptase (RNA-dependent DNA polymerase)